MIRVSIDYCLSCVLPDCDETSDRCGYRAARRIAARQQAEARLQREQAERREWQLTDNDRNRWRVLGSPW